jgi:hypothetical protein
LPRGGSHKRGSLVMVIKWGYWIHTFKRIRVLPFFANPQSQLQLHKKLNLPFSFVEDKLPESTKYDNYSLLICDNANEDTLAVAAQELWKFRIYPSRIMRYCSDFSLENRLMQPGDLVYQRVWVIPHLVETYCLSRVDSVIDTPTKNGFSYATTPVHDEIGKLTCSVELEDGRIYLKVNVVSYFDHFGLLARLYGRILQLRAHRAFLKYAPANMLENINKLKKEYE